MKIATERLFIRSWKSDDAEDALKIFGDANVMHFVRAPISSHEEAEKLIARAMSYEATHGFCRWAVEEATSARVIGSMGFKYLEDGVTIDIGFYFAKTHWGRGYALESGRACLEFAFKQLRLKKIVAITDLENFRTQRALDKMGFRFLDSRLVPEFDQRLMWYEVEA